jgi:hypothetical protein
MQTSTFPLPLPTNQLRRLSAHLRDRISLDELRARREHDDAMASDPRIALEHQAQVNRSLALDQGGCRFCG